MTKDKCSLLGEASTKSNDSEPTVQLSLPALELILQTKQQIEMLSAQAGLTIIQSLMEQEIRERCGTWGTQDAVRHGKQDGYVVYAGRKVSVNKPRLRSKEGPELPLESYRAFQQDGQMQRAVARKLVRQVSTRDYAGAIDQCLEGYGIGRSSVSRQWKAATAAELEKLCQRPVPSDIKVLLIDAKYFRQECLVVALGVDSQGTKHVLGLWHGSTENSTIVKALLNDLRERGLNTESSMLVVLDGAKALHKGVKEIFGSLALIQRCRIHKLRNVVEHLPKEKRSQAAWRLRGAWAKSTEQEAMKELRKVVQWLETISPSAARSLEEGLEETLTLQSLGMPKELMTSFHSTNLIESCFSRTESWTHRVKRWRDAKMVMRWGAAALLVAEAGFRRVRGCDQMPSLLQTLAVHQSKLAKGLKAA
jgi:putative transposase